MNIRYILVISFLLFSPNVGLAAQIEEYPLPGPYSNPVDIVSDDEGRLWYAAQNTGKIGRFEPAAKGFKEYDMTDGSDPSGVAYDRTNKLVWFTLSSSSHNSIGSISTETGGIKTYKVPTISAEPYKIAVAGDGSVWFTEANANHIASFKHGVIKEYEIPTKGSRPSGIAVDSKGVVWFTEASANKLARLDPSTGNIIEYDLQHAHASPAGVAVDKNDNVWFAETNGNRASMYNPLTREFNEAVI
ncbi:MAG: hypothetical protein HY880_05335, partial [Deltaproteobacteria bacterium]|nr:hypothetical protein [Deltaproteobacteria bacterium]